MADYQSDRTGANIDEILDNADAGNIGKSALAAVSDLNLLTNNGVYRASSSAGTLNIPSAEDFDVYHANSSATVATQIAVSWLTNKMYFRYKRATWESWQELYHTGNTGVLDFKNTVDAGGDDLSFATNEAVIRMNRPFTTALLQQFLSSGGVAGSINLTSANTVSFTTSSDNDLKNIIGKPTDEQINQKFNDIFDCFTLFDWKNGGNDQPVWGFLAWDVIDKGLDFGSEREGGKQNRALKIGDVYQEATYDEDGNELTPELRVTPAGVDQSKVVPYLVAKIEQLERRLSALEGANG